MSWHWFFPVVDGFAKAANPVSAVARDPDHLDLFVCGIDEKIYWTQWDAASGWALLWRPPAERTADGVVVGAASVTAVARDQDHLELFACSGAGTIYWARWETPSWAAFWQPLYTQADDGVVIRATSITAIARNANQLQLFVTEISGSVYSINWDSANAWQPSWFRIDNGFSRAASSVTAVMRDSDHVDLFVTGSDRRIYWTHCADQCDSASGWASWSPIDAGDGFAKGATSVAAVARNPDVLDVFVTGTDGRIYSTWWDSAGGWHWFFQPDDSFTNGATAVAAVARNPDELDLFVTGGDGATYSTWWRSASGWRSSWFRIDSGFAKGATAVAAVSRNPDELDLFVAGTDHGIYSTWWDPGPGILRRAAITFHPHNDKNTDTIIQVFIKNRLNNSLTPQQNTDFISNWLALQRYQPGGDIDDGDQNPYLAYRLFIGFNADNPSSEPIDLQLVSDDISADAPFRSMNRSGPILSGTHSFFKRGIIC